MIISINADLFRKPVSWIIIAGLSIGLAAGGYYIYRYKPNILSPVKDLKIQTSDSGQLNADQTQQLLAEVGKIIELPTGETPTVATISDVSKLKGQDFFKKAQNGDQVIIYPKAKKAYLYSTSLKKILEVEPISVPEATTSAILEPTVKIASPSATIAPSTAPVQ